jgi:hypothetical protein
MKNTVEVADRTENAITVRSIRTALPVFGSGQAAFNWARKHDANNVTVAVKIGRRYSALTLVRVGEFYEAR